MPSPVADREENFDKTSGGHGGNNAFCDSQLFPPAPLGNWRVSKARTFTHGLFCITEVRVYRDLGRARSVRSAFETIVKLSEKKSSRMNG